MIAQLIGGAIAILVGAALLGSVADIVVKAGCNDSYTVATASCNLTGWAATVTHLVTGFFALALMGTGVGMLYGVLREAGVF